MLRSNELLDSLKAGKTDDNVPPNQLQVMFRPSVQPYLISLFRQDPAAAFRPIEDAGADHSGQQRHSGRRQ
jgi:hypothetical protein